MDTTAVPRWREQMEDHPSEGRTGDEKLTILKFFYFVQNLVGLRLEFETGYHTGDSHSGDFYSAVEVEVVARAGC